MGRTVRVAGKKPVKMVAVTCRECGHVKYELNGAWLRWRREAAGIDQRTLAAKLKVSGPYLSDIERNRRACPFAVEQAYNGLRPVVGS